LVHVLGPCLKDGCLRRAHSWFVRERQWPVDDDCDVAVASVRDGARAVSGDLDAWRKASSSESDEQEQA
jgi:hypothetical protein